MPQTFLAPQSLNALCDSLSSCSTVYVCTAYIWFAFIGFVLWSESPSVMRCHCSSERPRTVLKEIPRSLLPSFLRKVVGPLPTEKNPIGPLRLSLYSWVLLPWLRWVKCLNEGIDEAMQPMPVSTLEQRTMWETQTI